MDLIPPETSYRVNGVAGEDVMTRMGLAPLVRISSRLVMFKKIKSCEIN